ncbi:hypothetical protein Tco_1384406 [Tanacetum coccineum]
MNGRNRLIPCMIRRRWSCRLLKPGRCWTASSACSSWTPVSNSWCADVAGVVAERRIGIKERCGVCGGTLRGGGASMGSDGDDGFGGGGLCWAVVIFEVSRVMVWQVGSFSSQKRRSKDGMRKEKKEKRRRGKGGKEKSKERDEDERKRRENSGKEKKKVEDEENRKRREEEERSEKEEVNRGSRRKEERERKGEKEERHRNRGTKRIRKARKKEGKRKRRKRRREKREKESRKKNREKRE